MESNPAVGLLGFWMMMQLIATLALVIGGIYLMYSVGRAASGLDRMANAMEDWVALQDAATQNAKTESQSPTAPSTPASPLPAPFPSLAPTQSRIEPQPEYSSPDESNR